METNKVSSFFDPKYLRQHGVNWLIDYGPRVVAAIIVLVIGWWVANAVEKGIRRICANRKLDATISAFIANLIQALIVTFVVITALERLGVDTKTFAAVVAAAGLAIGLALQASLSNFASGFLLIVFRPFKRGDVVNAGGVEGTIQEISIFSTNITTSDNKRITVPNSAIMGGNITNHTANDSRRVDLQFSIAAAENLTRVHSILLAAAATHPRVLKEPAPSVGNVRLVDGGTLVELRSWCKTEDHGSVNSDLIAIVPAALAREGVRGPDKTIAYREIR